MSQSDLLKRTRHKLDAALAHWRANVDRPSEPSYTDHGNGHITVGPYKPLAEDFNSAVESYHEQQAMKTCRDEYFERDRPVVTDRERTILDLFKGSDCDDFYAPVIALTIADILPEQTSVRGIAASVARALALVENRTFLYRLPEEPGPTRPYPHYRVTTLQGERHTLFAVVAQYSGAEEDWEVLRTYTTRDGATQHVAQLEQ